MESKQMLQLDQLSMLAIAPREAQRTDEDLQKLVAFADELPGLDMQPDRWQEKPAARLRADEPVPGLSREDALQNAAARTDECILVPKTVG